MKDNPSFFEEEIVFLNEISMPVSIVTTAAAAWD